MSNRISPLNWLNACVLTMAVALAPMPALAAPTADAKTPEVQPAASVPEAPASSSEASDPSAPKKDAKGPEYEAQGGPESTPPPPPSDHYEGRTGMGGVIAGSILTILSIGPIVGGVVVMKQRIVEDTGTAEVDQQLESVQQTETEVRKFAGGGAIGLGAILLAIGVPLLVVGSVRMAKYSKWKRERNAQLAPIYDSRRGVTAGLQYGFRF